MKNIIGFIIGFILFSCTASHNVGVIGVGKKMKAEYEMIATQYQLDSIARVDNIPNNFKYWLTSQYKDYEDKSITTKHMYIKEMDSIEIIYIVTPKDNKYVVTKRVVR